MQNSTKSQFSNIEIACIDTIYDHGHPLQAFNPLADKCCAYLIHSSVAEQLHNILFSFPANKHMRNRKAPLKNEKRMEQKGLKKSN